jgi:hypothetical protein
MTMRIANAPGNVAGQADVHNDTDERLIFGDDQMEVSS